MKNRMIPVIYEAGPGRDTPHGVDFMLADISELDLDETELYAEVDPYDFIPEMGGRDKMAETFPEYADAIREYYEENGEVRGSADLEKLFDWICATVAENSDGDYGDLYAEMRGERRYFMDVVWNAFCGDAYVFTENYLKAEITAQAEELGIDPALLDF